VLGALVVIVLLAGVAFLLGRSRGAAAVTNQQVSAPLPAVEATPSPTPSPSPSPSPKKVKSDNAQKSEKPEEKKDESIGKKLKKGGKKLLDGLIPHD
jgi:hypothetical protein